MLFSSNVFVFGFLPLVLTLYFALPGNRSRGALLLAASLVFYAWGEPLYVGVLLLTILLAWSFGLIVERSPRMLAPAVAAILAPLVLFKLAPLHLPIGISFFTFQALTYVVDVYRRDAPLQWSPLRVALYISLFPQLVAGPIVRYREIAGQLVRRISTLEDVAAGLRRFAVGLGKKLLLADALARPVDAIFALPEDQLTASVAWLGAVGFGLQIYFDFSGYSDMAIGLGRVFGFRFPENFDRPYVSRSLREFWRRWHISLSSWFRDYVYIPLGGSRGSGARTALNLALVFLLCGLWHGVELTFLAWAAIHGGCMALERTAFGAKLASAGPLSHLYATIVVLVSWVVFRSESIGQASAFLAAMFGAGPVATEYPIAIYLDAQIALILGVAALASVVRPPRLPGWAQVVLSTALLLLCAMALAERTHQPFIYFRF